jgi:hypothetical protein
MVASQDPVTRQTLPNHMEDVSLTPIEAVETDMVPGHCRQSHNAHAPKCPEVIPLSGTWAASRSRGRYACAQHFGCTRCLMVWDSVLS